jgi:hypothetical protein
MASDARTWLQRRSFRSVALERDADGAAVVVKRFHDPRPWRRLLDPWRALREHRVLQELGRDALPVPRSRGVRRGPSGWELAMDAVPGACSLEAWSLASEAPPGGWPALASRLGRALAILARLGWRHPDPTLRNVLVDEHGNPWAVDWAGARRSSPSRTAAWRTLIALAAPLRERWPRTLRLRALTSWWQELPPELRPLGDVGAAARRAEQAARAERLRQVRAGLGRWLRPSSRVRVAERDGLRLLVRADLDDDALREALAGEAPRLRITGAARDVERAWLAAARLLEHGLPAVRPELLARGAGQTFAILASPHRTAGDERSLAQALADRGLVVEPSATTCGPTGTWVAVPERVREGPTG